MANSRVDVAVEKSSAFSKFWKRQGAYFSGFLSPIMNNHNASRRGRSSATELREAIWRKTLIEAFGASVDEDTVMKYIRQNDVDGKADQRTFERVIGFRAWNILAWPHFLLNFLNRRIIVAINNRDEWDQYRGLTISAKAIVLFFPGMLEVVSRLLLIPSLPVELMLDGVNQMLRVSVTSKVLDLETEALLAESIHQRKDGMTLVLKKDKVVQREEVKKGGFSEECFSSNFSPFSLSTGNILKRISDGDCSVEIDEKANLDSGIVIDQKKINNAVLIGEKLTETLLRTSNYGSFDDSTAILVNKEGVIDEKTNDEEGERDEIGEQDELSASLIGEKSDSSVPNSWVPSNILKNIFSFFSPPRDPNLGQSEQLPPSPSRSFRRSGSE